MTAPKVFIVDDALDYRTLLSRAFKDAGYKVYLANDGMQAYIKFFKVKPDIVLADILLPRMRGDVLIKWLKGTSLGKAVPIIVIFGHKKMKDYLYELGIDFFFEKPISTREVLAIAQEVLEIYGIKAAIAERLKKLRRHADKELLEDEPKELQKICEACHQTATLEALHCESCGSSSLHIVEKSSTMD